MLRRYLRHEVELFRLRPRASSRHRRCPSIAYARRRRYAQRLNCGRLLAPGPRRCLSFKLVRGCRHAAVDLVVRQVLEQFQAPAVAGAVNEDRAFAAMFDGQASGDDGCRMISGLCLSVSQNPCSRRSRPRIPFAKTRWLRPIGNTRLAALNRALQRSAFREKRSFLPQAACSKFKGLPNSPY